MKKLLAAMAVVLAVAAPAAAEVRSMQVCQQKLLSPSNSSLYGLGNGLADCAYTDISGFKFFSYQFRCNSASTTISVSVDWIAGSAMGSLYMAVPLLSSGSAMSQLKTAYTTESTTTWSTLMSIQPPVSPVGTIRITNGATTADVLCDVILNMGN